MKDKRDSATSASTASTVTLEELDEELWSLELTPTTRSSLVKPERSSQKNRPKRSVSFDKVKVREYERVLAEHPPSAGGFVGPSLGLGWNFHEKKSVLVDTFEKVESNMLFLSFRNSKQPRRRHSKEILMSAEQRAKIAKKLGYSITEICDNTKQMEKIIQRRQRTNTKFLQELRYSTNSNYDAGSCDAMAAFQQACQQQGYR